jgi:hypothetical protein
MSVHEQFSPHAPGEHRSGTSRTRALAAALIALALCVTACSTPSGRSAAQGSRQTVRLQQPPNEAAACFARNAEEHSSALSAEISQRGNSAEVIVRVKNGVLYGTGEFQRAGAGSTASISLMVTTTGRRSDLLDALLEGC